MLQGGDFTNFNGTGNILFKNMFEYIKNVY